jgi:hypothetical protein
VARSVRTRPTRTPITARAPLPARRDLMTPVEAFVEAMADDLGLGGCSSDRRTRRQLLRLAQWATGEGIALDRELILDPDTVERFVVQGLVNERSASTYRAVLRRVGPLLTRRAPWEPRPVAIPRRQLASPYKADEVLTLMEDAVDQPSASRQRAAIALLVLGLGVGLDGRWATRVKAADLGRDGDAVTVVVGEPRPRTVVCLASMEEELLGLALTAGDAFLVGGHSNSKNRAGELAARLAVPTGHPRLSPARLRSTWLLWHLEAGTRLPELCRAAGLRGTQVLGDLLPYVEELCPDCTTQMLREAR